MMTNGLLTRKQNILAVLFLGAVILALVLCFVFANTSVAQADAVISVSMSEKNVHRGQTFSVDVTVTNNTGLTSMLLMVDYDDQAFNLIDVVQGDGLSEMTMTTTNVGLDVGYAVHPFNVLFDSTTSAVGDGVIAQFVFESNINAEIGDYTISLSYDPTNTNSAYNTPVALNVKSGLIHLQSGEFSARYVDWNGDVLYERDYNEGAVPSYVGETPTREEDECYSYEFSGWKGDLAEEANVLQYRAQYKKTPKIYSVSYYVDGITGVPDDEYTVEDFYISKEVAYGENVDLDIEPRRANYTFVGWFADEERTMPITSLTMPANNIRVYAYMRYNVRTNDIPKIRLSYTQISETSVEVQANLTYNPSLNAMVLTLSYDRNALKFTGFKRGMALQKMQFDTTNLSGGLDQEDFRFYWEGAENSTETGLILTMTFDIIADTNGIYPVTFTYDETHHASYLMGLDIWYTRLDIIGTKIPVGEKYHWNEPVGDVHIDVTSEDGKPLDVELLVKNVNKEVSEESMTKLGNQNLEIKNMYSINLIRNGEVVASETDLRVGIGLTPEELASQRLALYYLDDNGKLNPYDFTVEDDAAVFHMRNIEYWVLVGDAPAPQMDKSWTPEMIRSVLLPSLLSLTAFAYALILLAQNYKLRKELGNLKGKGGKK